VVRPNWGKGKRKRKKGRAVFAILVREPKGNDFRRKKNSTNLKLPLRSGRKRTRNVKVQGSLNAKLPFLREKKRMGHKNTKERSM